MQNNLYSYTSQIDETSAITVIKPSGRIDAHTVSRLRNEIQSAFQQGDYNLVVDLSAVNFMDSSGLAVLVQGMQRCQASGGQFGICAPLQPVRMILELTRLDQAIRIFSDEQEAIASFSTAAGAP